MRLKKLKLRGFKSFAGDVHLDFEADVIGLVGPNGCGKSNIVDAFRWVLGEQSARSMRALAMNDVIFAGSATRKPVNFAEVTLTLSDIDPQMDQVEVTRRLYRSGESEYLINKEHVRLKDIQNLFLGSGVGKRAFSIFEQGKLDEIIHVSPFERRALFDEAAGIGKFLQNKKDASKHLSEVAANYDRIKDLHQEIDKRRKQLKKQAEEALLHQENKRRLESLEIAILCAKLRKLIATADSWKEDQERLSQELDSEKINYSALEARFEGILAFFQKKESASKIADEKVYSTQSLLKIKGAEEKREKERLQELEGRFKKLTEELTLLQKQKEPLQEELKDLQEKRSSAVILKERAEKERNSREEKHLLAEKNLKEARAQENIIREQMMQLVFQKGSLEKEASLKKERVERAYEELKKLEIVTHENEKHFLELEEEEKKRQADVKKVIALIDLLKEEILKLEESLKKQTLELEECEKESLLFHRKIQEKESDRKAITSLQESYEGFSPGTKALLKESKNPKSPLFEKIGLFYEEFLLPPSHEKALLLATKSFATTLTTKNQEDLKLVLDFALKRSISDFSIVTSSKSKKIGTHFHQEIAFSETIETLLEQKKEGVASDGFYVDAHGVIFKVAGEAVTENNAIQRELKIVELGKELLVLHQAKEQLDQTLDAKRARKTSLEKSLKEKEERRRKEEMTLVQENFYLQQARTFLKKNREERQRVTLEKEKLEKRAKDESEHLERLLQEVSSLGEREKNSKVLALAKESALKELNLEFETFLAEKKKEDISYYAVLSDFRSTLEKIKVFEGKQEDLLQREAKYLKELEEMKKGAAALEKKWKEVQKELQLASQELEEAHVRQKSEAGALASLKQERDDLEKILQRERKKIDSLNHKEHRLELSFAENKALRIPLQEELKTRFSIAIEEVKEDQYPLESSLEESEKILQRFRYETEKGAMVNLTSIEEAKVEEERFSAIDLQLSDLKSTKEDIEKIVQKLDQESRKAFKTTFEQVRANFQKNFALLFNGGRADLKFTNSSDVLEAGVEIFAEPPGKQMRTISLLSGGEKCMTALALLFSIFEVRPAPFCILDEVDAPLDDANVERFTHVLRQFTPTTQFIIVTHNKKTMAITDLLFGVSMEEKGVSKLVSLLFEKSKRA